MISSKAARRYATALLGFALDRKKVGAILKDITFIRDSIEASRELLVFLKSPVVNDAKKRDVLSEIFKKHIGGETWQFIELMADKSRLNLLPEACGAFIEAYNTHAGIIDVEVVFASEPDTAQISAIRKSLEAKTGKTVRVSTSVSPGLIGGIMVRMDDTVIDGSVRNKLQKLEQKFYRAAI